MYTNQASALHQKECQKCIVYIVLILCLAIGIHVTNNHVRDNYSVESESTPAVQVQTKFIKGIARPAIAQYRSNHKILPSIIIAQAILKSNWGKTKLYKEAKNPFASKGNYDGKSLTCKTPDVIGSHKHYYKARFKKYPTISTAIENQDNILSHDVVHQTDVIDYIKEAHMLQNNSYTSAPQYAQKLIQTIKAYRLNHYDKLALFIH